VSERERPKRFFLSGKGKKYKTDDKRKNKESKGKGGGERGAVRKIDLKQ
jgi:hypothetical protein